MKINCSYVIDKLNSIVEKYGDLEVVELVFHGYEDDEVDIYDIEPYVVVDPKDDNKFVVILD